jgi:hypothetical protein
LFYPAAKLLISTTLSNILRNTLTITFLYSTHRTLPLFAEWFFHELGQGLPSPTGKYSGEVLRSPQGHADIFAKPVIVQFVDAVNK